MATIRYIKDENENVVLPVTHERGVIDSQGTNLETKLAGKQDTLVSGTSIKTINNESILGNGNITVQTSITTDTVPTIGSTNPVQSGGVYTALQGKQGTLESGVNIKTINDTSLLGSGNITIEGSGRSIESITTNEDGIIVILFSDGDSITIDLNHVHPQYLQYVYLTDESQMPATPDATTLYLILDSNA